MCRCALGGLLLVDENLDLPGLRRYLRATDRAGGITRRTADLGYDVGFGGLEVDATPLPRPADADDMGWSRFGFSGGDFGLRG